MCDWTKTVKLNKQDRKMFEDVYHISYDPADPDQGRTYISHQYHREPPSPEVQSETTISREFLDHHRKHNGSIDEEAQLMDHIKHQLTGSLVSGLIEKGLVKVTNVTENALTKWEKNLGMLSDYEQDLVDKYHTQGEVKIVATLSSDADSNGFRFDEFNIDKVDPIKTDTISKDDAEFLWKLLPPRITGIPEQKHPLQPGWMGTLPRKRDKYIIERVKRILNK